MRHLLRLAAASAFIGVMGVSLATPAMAAPPTREPRTPSGFGPAPAGIACAFPVSIDLISGDEGHDFTFFDKNGNVVRQMSTARPSTWAITNLDTGASYSFNLPAGHLRLTTSSDGTTTVVISGASVGFNAPTDTPPGPFTTSDVGRLVLVIDPDGNGTILSVSGKEVDLCAAVAS